MKHPKFEAVVFDLDHTLFDRYSTLRGISYLLKQQYAERLNPALSTTQLGDMLAAADKSYIYEGWPMMYEKLLSQGLFIDPPPFEEYFEFFMDCFKRIAVPIPLVDRMLTQLRGQGRRIGLITNGSPKTQRPKLALLGLEEAFDQVIIGREFGIEKPDVRPFEAMAERLGFCGSHMLYVGDHPMNDVEGARRAGYTPVWVKTSGEWPFPKIARAPYEINDVLELPLLLEKIDPVADIAWQAINVGF